LSGESYRLRGKKKYLEGNATKEEFQLENDRENQQRKGGDD